MKRLLYFSFIFVFANGLSQGEQLYADGVANDQNGNIYNYRTYGDQVWTIENAEMITYRDGTTIPQVTDFTEWENLTTGAWAYYDNDPTKPRFYNWYAIMGIHDEASLTDVSLRKEFAPEGWHVPTDAEWTTFENYCMSFGYNCDNTTWNNKFAKALASNSGWTINNLSSLICTPGYNQSSNNSSGFNAFPEGIRTDYGQYFNEGDIAVFWTSTAGSNNEFAYGRTLISDNISLNRYSYGLNYGISVRFVRDAQTASVGDNSIYNFKIFPNPAKNYLNIDCSSIESVLVYDILGKELIKDTTNRINVSHLPKGVYFIKVSDGMNSSTKKFIKN